MKLTKVSLIFIVILVLLSSARLLRPGYYSMQDDMHIFRLQQLGQCLVDGQFPCRYISQAGFGYGYPLFNFYPPFFYLVCWLFNQIGFNLINSIKLVLFLSNITGIAGIYLLSKKILKNNNTALLSATLFAFFPYRATDIYVRGAFAEIMAINLIPLTIYFYYTYSVKPKKIDLILASLLSTFLFLSHNLISLLSFPIIIFFIFWPKFKFDIKKFTPLILSLLISSFFVIPALFEKKYVTIDTMTQGYFDYRAHFVTLKQLFLDRSWNYGASLWGPVDDMSFQVGIPQWPLAIIAIFLYIKSKNKSKSKTILLAFLGLLSLFSLFLTHSRSTIIWNNISFLKYFQFPWRFLSINVFSMSLLSSVSIIYLKPSFQKMIAYLLIILTIALNINYFKEDIYFPYLNDKDKLTSSEILRQSGAGLKDYWPVFGQNFPTQFASNLPQTGQTDTNIVSFQKKSNSLTTRINVNQSFDTITLPLVYFPGWQLSIDNQTSHITIDQDLGLIQTPPLSQGQHTIDARLGSTPIQTISNILSIIGLVGLIILSIL